MGCRYEGTGIWAGRCKGTREVDPCPGYDKCKQYKPDYPTNADRMDAMSIMEKAKFLTSVVANGCPPDMDWCCEKDSGGWDACDDCWCKWLRQPAGGADDAAT